MKQKVWWICLLLISMSLSTTLENQSGIRLMESEKLVVQAASFESMTVASVIDKSSFLVDEKLERTITTMQDAVERASSKLVEQPKQLEGLTRITQEMSASKQQSERLYQSRHETVQDVLSAEVKPTETTELILNKTPLSKQVEPLVLEQIEGNLLTLPVLPYIEAADELSRNIRQVSYHDVMVLYVLLEGMPTTEVSIDTIVAVTKPLATQSLEDVLQSLSSSESLLIDVKETLEQLKTHGLKPERLQPSSRELTFIESIRAAAVENYERYEILPSITIAQAILESGWGESGLAVSTNNYFGIKDSNSWEGETYDVSTREYIDTVVTATFRVYETPTQSILDHGQFLYENGRYQSHGVFDAKTYRYQAQALEEAGYSTDMDEAGRFVYAEKLIEIIRLYNLQLIDAAVQVIK